MFKTAISSTALTTFAADEAFPGITAPQILGDLSLLSTLRALIAPKMEDGETLHVQSVHREYTADMIGGSPASRMVQRICGFTDSLNKEGTFYLVNFRNYSQVDRYACIELMKSSFGQVYEGWQICQSVEEFYRKSFFVVCFINSEIRSVCLFVDNLTLTKLHYLQCGIFAFLPWYNPGESISAEDMELITSLCEKTEQKYLSCIERFAAKYDFRTQRIRSLLSGFEYHAERTKSETASREILAHMQEIDSLNDRIAKHLQAKAELEARMLGFQLRAENAEDSELMEYFLQNKRLVLLNVKDTTIQFGCRDYLEYFDEDLAKTVIENRRSFVYRPNGRACNNYIPEEDMKLFMEALFIEQTIRMKACAVYSLSYRGSVEAQSHFPYGYEFRDCTPNPHIDAYRCMGNYSRIINELLMNNNYIGAVEQCIASCKSLNFGDSIVMSEFMCRIYGFSDNDVNMCCVELPDGTTVTPKDAIQWLKSQKGASTNE